MVMDPTLLARRLWKLGKDIEAGLTALNASNLSSGFVPNDRLGKPLFKVTGIDGKVVAATLVATTATGRGRFVVSNIDLIATALDTLTGAPTVSVGANGTDYDDVVPATELVEISANGVDHLSEIAGHQATVAENTGIYLNNTTGATATTLTLTVVINGYYVG